MAGFAHVPVLADQTLAALAPQSGGVYIDGTLGGAGHSRLILEQSAPDGFLLGIDRDDDALRAAEKNLEAFDGRFRLVKGNFADMDELARSCGITAADGVLLDIGVSSYQLDEGSRGFSSNQDAPLDMRMDRSQSLTAGQLVNEAPVGELTRILYEYGEEKWAARIAEFIADERSRRRIESSGQLVDIIKKAVPAGARDKDQHPAKRTFQALRIAVNGELEALSAGLEAAIGLLKPGGKLAVITFHSLEDRIVKDCFRLHATDCICPPRQPVCTCGHKADIRLYNRKPITADQDELTANPRSRSANLRVAVKL
ncbi:MAG: 16S rRNA (cytosine(1402)-N(4))-methyltransferase RsmH [Firmicutes bacterium]|nr:16S rRNA (cytosine(1402)-N(4))-methyltransferase RsmH [Bacillota bacterium]